MAASFTALLPVGTTALADPFYSPSNTVNDVFANPGGSSDGDFIYFYNCGGAFQILVVDSSSPSGFSNTSGDAVDSAALPLVVPGRGMFYRNTTGVPESITFTGSVPVAVFPPSFYCGCGQYAFLGAKNTNSSSYQDYMGTDPVTGSQVFVYIPGHAVSPITSQNYTVYTYTNTAWSPANPPLSIGVPAFFYMPCNATNAIILRGNGSGTGFPNWQTSLTLTGSSNSSAVILGTSDFKTWTPLVTNPLTGGTIIFTDTVATNFTSRFYKARWK